MFHLISHHVISFGLALNPPPTKSAHVRVKSQEVIRHEQKKASENVKVENNIERPAHVEWPMKSKNEKKGVKQE